MRQEIVSATLARNFVFGVEDSLVLIGYLRMRIVGGATLGVGVFVGRFFGV